MSIATHVSKSEKMPSGKVEELSVAMLRVVARRWRESEVGELVVGRVEALC